MRKNRYDPTDEDADRVIENPRGFTRASRRSAGYRAPAWADAMREFHGQQLVYPRAIRRLLRDPLKAEKRLRRERAKVNRLLAPMGVSL